MVSAFLLMRVNLGSTTLMKLSTRNPVTPGEFGFTVERFRDIKNYDDVDILFLGSSHSYRTFDTRIYNEYGLKTFNMGTTGQTPLNGYYLLKHYFDQLKPELVILELYFNVMDRDGLESLYDLSTNMPFYRELLEMAIAVGSPHGINEVIAKWIASKTGSEPHIKQIEMEGEAYVPGGYVEFTTPSQYSEEGKKPVVPRKVIPLDYQLEYLEKIIRFVKERNARIILITQTVPPRLRKSVKNYNEISETFSNIAAKYHIPYWDFNKIMPLPVPYFQDRDHLSVPGVKRFNQAVIDTLFQRGLVERASTEGPSTKGQSASIHP